VISYLIKLITLSPDGEARNNVTLGSPASVTADGFLADINVQSVDDDNGLDSDNAPDSGAKSTDCPRRKMGSRFPI
jgi:hypothetical protein